MDTSPNGNGQTNGHTNGHAKPVAPNGYHPDGKAKHAGGRAKKYSVQFIQAEAAALIEYANLTSIPLLTEFCPKRGYSSKTVLNCKFAEVEEFEAAINIFKDIQEAKLARGAMEGKLNAYMANMTLKNVAGWREQPAVLVDNSKHFHQTFQFDKMPNDDLVRKLTTRGSTAKPA